MHLLTAPPENPMPGFDPATLAVQKVDECLGTSDGTARCALWWKVVPMLDSERSGIIGHFSGATVESAAYLLDRAADRLRENGCTIAIGPMDGNTWRRYRVLTERGNEPPFFMEPDNPDWWAEAFEKAGFSPLARYSSSLVTDLARTDPRAGRVRERLEHEGVRIRHLVDFEGDLRRIYAVSVASFTDNFLYTAMSEEAFLAQYRPYQERIVPELVLIAEHEARPVGYLFAIPDYAEAMRGERMKTVVGKTIAVVPGRRQGGLGLLMTMMVHKKALALGYERLIHALQHEGNRVRKMSDALGTIMRRYVLFSRRLA